MPVQEHKVHDTPVCVNPCDIRSGRTRKFDIRETKLVGGFMPKSFCASVGVCLKDIMQTCKPL